MFKVASLEGISNVNTQISILNSEVKNYKNNLHYFYKYLDFCIEGEKDGNQYSLSFRLDKPIESLLDIELNTSVQIEDYIDCYDAQLGINGIFDLNTTIRGKIYRIISNNIIISGNFIASDDCCGAFEIEFNLNDYLKEDGKSDV